MSQGKGTVNETDLMRRLVEAKKIMNKVEVGDFERGNVNHESFTSSPEELMEMTSAPEKPIQRTQPNIDKIRESKLPDAIKQAMIDNPIPQISLTESLDLDFVSNTKKLMEKEGLGKKPTTKSSSPSINPSEFASQITPIIENVVRKTVDEILDKRLSQILTAQQTLSINENLVLKVGDSIFKGKITGVNKSK